MALSLHKDMWALPFTTTSRFPSNKKTAILISIVSSMIYHLKDFTTRRRDRARSAHKASHTHLSSSQEWNRTHSGKPIKSHPRDLTSTNGDFHRWLNRSKAKWSRIKNLRLLMSYFIYTIPKLSNQSDLHFNGKKCVWTRENRDED